MLSEFCPLRNAPTSRIITEHNDDIQTIRVVGCRSSNPWYMSCVEEGEEKVDYSRMGVRIRRYWLVKYPGFDCNHLQLQGVCR